MEYSPWVVPRTLTFNVRKILKNYGEISTATATERKSRRNIRAIAQKMKITPKIGLKIEKTGSTSPKTRFLGCFCDFLDLPA
jgi:hypothetical protein